MRNGMSITIVMIIVYIVVNNKTVSALSKSTSGENSEF